MVAARICSPESDSGDLPPDSGPGSRWLDRSGQRGVVLVGAMMRCPGGAGRLLQYRPGVVVQRAEQLGEGWIDGVRVSRPAGVLFAQECGVRAAEGGGQDVHASHCFQFLICAGAA